MFAMAENFNAKEDAKIVESLGHMLLHGYSGDGPLLPDKFAHLTPLQADALNTQLKWDNWKANTNPNVQVLFDDTHHINGFAFTPSIYDSTAQGAYLVIGVGNNADATDK
jgi:hypothetical protein